MASHPLGSEARPLRVAVVGSGPSAFYAIEALFKAADLSCRVDVFDRLPTPYGLVRGGVAPDHQKIKSVVRVYEKTAAQPGFRFFGNVALGRDVLVDDLTAHYDRIIYGFGNESDRRLGIPGEELAGVHAATAFVGWYNGHPDFQGEQFDLERATRVAVVGNGNVAMDVARLLVRSPDELAETDIADAALDVLRQSKVREVVLLGRRGPAQAAFSPKEIEEVGGLAGVNLVVPPQEIALDELSAQWLEGDAPRSAGRNVSYLRKQSEAGADATTRQVRCRFLVSPVEFVGDGDRVTAVRLQRNELVAGDDGEPRPKAVDSYDEEPVDLVFKAIGYRGDPVPGVPHDARRGIVPNRDGRVLDAPDGSVVPGQYVVGWAKRGPTGLIGTNSPDSKLTVEALLQDIAGVEAEALDAADAERVPALLRSRGVDAVSFADWEALDRHEIEAGRARGKARSKLSSVDEMLAAIREARSAQ
ncbi:MAG: FAD-dependent oxidoreductase [Planctomycetota bacterium]